MQYIILAFVMFFLYCFTSGCDSALDKHERIQIQERQEKADWERSHKLHEELNKQQRIENNK